MEMRKWSLQSRLYNYTDLRNLSLYYWRLSACFSFSDHNLGTIIYILVSKCLTKIDIFAQTDQCNLLIFNLTLYHIDQFTALHTVIHHEIKSFEAFNPNRLHLHFNH